ncbi:MAG: RtcB family protein, partial [Elusimicrobia bacterium]|nr:RtcB family protein [Elusimicrobiota bacterium]
MLRKIDDFRWEIPREGAMRVPGLIFASEKLINKIDSERVTEQVRNVATLPGIVGHALAMPDAHWGYGFAVGGVAATDAEHGVISPGGIGFDISCGVRLLRTDLDAERIRPRLDRLLDALFHGVPSGVGAEGRIHLKPHEMRRVFEGGAAWAVAEGYGGREDLAACEDGG